MVVSPKLVTVPLCIVHVPALLSHACVSDETDTPASCDYAHGEEERRCSQWTRHSICSETAKGGTCPYRHDTADPAAAAQAAKIWEQGCGERTGGLAGRRRREEDERDGPSHKKHRT
jgi:hypothetical protein